MVEEVETEESGLKALVQYKYVNLSPRIAKLSAILAQPNNPGITHANLQVHGKLVELMLAAYPNQEFQQLTARVFQKYVSGQQITGKRFRTRLSQRSGQERATRPAKDTLYAWNIVTRALIQSKLLVLKD